jgi:hypothetical protein
MGTGAKNLAAAPVAVTVEELSWCSPLNSPSVPSTSTASPLATPAEVEPRNTKMPEEVSSSGAGSSWMKMPL